MKAVKSLDNIMLKDYPKLKKDDSFEFGCHPGIECFNKCCNDVNIFLTPYDVIRLKNRLGIKSGEFLDKYTILPIEEHLMHPVIMLKMDEQTLNCPLVSEGGCTVYSDRPWSCRMYPLGVASPKENPERKDEEMFFLIKESLCKGFDSGKKWTVLEWMDDQGVGKYNEFGEMFKEISLHDHFLKGRPVEPVKLEMFYMVCYDIDKFREFIYGSSFLKRFEVGGDLIEKMRCDDEELLRFGFKWLRYAMFGEQTIKVRDDYMQPTAD